MLSLRSALPLMRVAHSVRAMSATSKMPSKILAANRGEIAVRIMRAATELGVQTVGIYSHEDRHAQHRYKADESFLLQGEGSVTPVGAYLDQEEIIRIAVANGVEAIHPGYGFLSENVGFAQMCEDNGIRFIGPTTTNLSTFADKTTAREVAIAAGVPVVPGTDGPISTFQEAEEFCSEFGFPIIIKAAMGGGGKGMRVVRAAEDLEENFNLAASEALAAFGDGTVFLERYVESPRHIEVQILGDGQGNCVHLYERDCSVQRRHQKVVEIAPASHIEPGLRQQLHDDAVRLCAQEKYRNAGTVEFLLDAEGRHYFIEVNPRVQVEHTVTEQVTGIDIVQSQMRIAAGHTFDDLGLAQDKISPNCFAIQCRITTEDPTQGFLPDTGVITTYRAAEGNGVRLDGVAFPGIKISPHYDSMLVKVTSSALDFESAVRRQLRALREYRIRGVKTNIPFLTNVLEHPEFVTGAVTTSFIDENPDLLQPAPGSAHGNRAIKLLNYVANLAVNGHPAELGASGPPCEVTDPVVPELSQPPPPVPEGWKQVLERDGPDAFAKKVRAHDGLLLTDTTWRDAHQSLLATRMRTRELLQIAPATSRTMSPLLSLENWGGATFDVSMRFLHECPWERLEKMREAVPNIPFQMLLRGANAVGYTSYADNVVEKFCEQAVNSGMDIFRIFDSLNYVENMRLGIDAVGAAGGVVEAALCYTGDVSDPTRQKYNIDYCLEYVRQLDKLGIHILAIKDMAGLLKPQAARQLVGAIRSEFGHLPIHVHTHDTAGTGVASMLACAEAGADAVDVCFDAFAGLTSQPSMGAVVASAGNTGLNLEDLEPINGYWEGVRGLYAPFESGQKSGSSDVYLNEIPGGQYTNLLFQAKQLNLGDRWAQIKKAYASANLFLGDIPKVTPSSKVVGDLAQFMVANECDDKELRAQLEAGEALSLPASVIEYFQGYLGVPPGGFDEALRAKVLRDTEAFEGRPGAELEPFDFDAERASLEAKWPNRTFRDVDIMSSALYPAVFEDWINYREQYGDVEIIPTRLFLEPMRVGEEVAVEIQHGKTLFLKLVTISDVDHEGHRTCAFEVNGEHRVVRIRDENVETEHAAKERANELQEGSVGAPMPGVVVELRVDVGDDVNKGDPLLVLSAMKMETIVAAPASGRVERIVAQVKDSMDAGDLLLELDC